MNTLKQFQALCDGLASKEYADGAVTVEYVIIIMFVVGLGAALIAFRDSIIGFIKDAGNSVNTTLSNLSSTGAKTN